MAKLERKRWPGLAKYWDDYGHSVKWEDLFDSKVAHTHHFVALAWKEGDLVNYATISGYEETPGKVTWDMQNDGHEPVTLSAWKKARVVPECDWLDIDR